MGSRLALLLASGLVAVMMFNVTNGFGTQTSSTSPASTAGSASAAPADAARRTAEIFFTAWQDNDLDRAAAVTDDPSEARATLHSYRSSLGLRGLRFAIQRVTAQGTVLYSITADVEDSPLTAEWTYDDFFTTYPVDGVWLIKWAPQLVAPNLTSTETLALHPVPYNGSSHSAGAVVDAAGNDLSSSADAGVHAIAAALAARAPRGQGTAGLEVELMAGSTPLTDTADVIRQPTSDVSTTIDAKAQAAAETTVHSDAGSAIVVLQPSTGHVLAVADNDDGRDLAQTAVPCGTTFRAWFDGIGDSGETQGPAAYFGLDKTWNIGLGTAMTYADVSAAQGTVEVSPLALASMAATIDTGSFEQPTVTAGQSRADATPLPATVKQALWQSMEQSPSGVYLQTGAGQGTGSWAVAFDPALDVAVGTLVLGGSSDSARSEAAALFKALP